MSTKYGESEPTWIRTKISSTGYTGNFLPVGADHFLEDASAFVFSGPTQADWAWNEVGTDLMSYADGNIDMAGGVEFADFLIFSST